MKKTLIISCLGSILLAMLASCGGGGGGESLLPPAYNVTGTWDVTMTIGVNNGGIETGTSGSGLLVMNQQAGSNTVYLSEYGVVGDAQPATLSDTKLTYNGPFLDMYGCTSMVANITATFSSATRFSGNGRLTCQEAAISGDVTFTGSKQ